MATAILSSKGQLTIPLTVREKLGVGTGDRIEFVELPDGSFRVTSAVVDVRTLRGVAAAKGSRTKLTIDQMNAIVRKRGAGR